ncbi:MAG: N-acetylmuramoyl-L-alanine amidase [candidate division Zixibacteria bacterium]|nr:N-acetylmuramoyl-L-alanine amidase [candidate division Zixibacteria bacterium]
MTSTFQNSKALICAFGLLALASAARADSTDIVVVYPKPGQTIGATDSTFILGHLSDKLVKLIARAAAGKAPKPVLKINGTTVPVHKGGGFLAFLPIDTGDFIFHLKVTGSGKHAALTALAELDLPVRVPVPLKLVSPDTLRIVGDYRPPQGDIALSTGDRLDVQFHGMPGGVAWFSIPGVIDSVPMSEDNPIVGAPSGEAVFGPGSENESMIIGGIYSGFWFIPAGAKVSGQTICYHLCKSAGGSNGKEAGKCITAMSQYRISLNPPQFPFTVRFIDSMQTVRVGPKYGYYSIFQPRGVTALAVGSEADWYRIKLSATQYGWVAKASVEQLSPGLFPPQSILSSIRALDSARSVTLVFPLQGQHPYRVIEHSPRQLAVQLFGVTSNTDWIRYAASDSLIRYCNWRQVEDDLYELTVNLNRDIWGYDCYYDGNDFCMKIVKRPGNIHSIKGKTIVVDAGHSADPGSIGPTGFTEAEANLGIALALRKSLEARGAMVVMTRNDMSNVALYDRPGIAKQAGADMFVSVHNNSLPDGLNPFTNNGTSVIYYHNWSADLARHILSELLLATRLPDHGLYWGNLAVNRPTQYPAVLVECDFMILPEREALLKTKTYQTRLGEAIARGIDAFFRTYADAR